MIQLDLNGEKIELDLDEPEVRRSQNPEIYRVYRQLIERYGTTSSSIPRDALFAAGEPSREANDDLVDWVKSRAGSRILDIGCGFAPYVERLRHLGFDCIGVDNNESFVKDAQARNLPVKLMDAHQVGFRRKSFETVLLIEVLEHVGDPEAAVREAARVASQNLLVTVPSVECLPYLTQFKVVPHHFLDPGHRHFYTRATLSKLLSQAASEVRVEDWAHFFVFQKAPMLFYHLRAEAKL